MKRIYIIICLLILTCSAYAEQIVGKYYNLYFGKEYEIKASQLNDKLDLVFIGVEAKDSKSAFIVVEGKDLGLFKTALELVRDKYLDWVKIAKENNVTKINKEFGIKFPSVDVAWLGSEWWFSFRNEVNIRFLILEDGRMVAAWASDVVSSSNQYIDETLYIAFRSKDDFNNLISQLDSQAILEQLRKKKNEEDLFQ